MKKVLYLIFLVSSFSFSQAWEIMKRASIEQAGVSAIFDIVNAANPVNEANTTTGFYDRGLTNGSVSFTSVTTSPTPQNGSFSIRMEHTGLTNNDCEGLIDITVENGSTYKVEVYVQEINGTNWQFILRTAFGWTSNETTAINAGGWTLYTLTATTNATTVSLSFYGTTSADPGDQLAYDNIVITKQ